MATTDRIELDEDGLCKRCAAINWDEMAYIIEKHFPMLLKVPGERLRLEVFDMATTISDSRAALTASPCRFCRLLARALAVHSLATPGQLECVHDGSSMVSIQMESMVSAFAVTLDDVAGGEKTFAAEYANIREIDYGLVKADMRACEQAHTGCAPDVLGELPGFRLIDCDTQIVVAASTTKGRGTAGYSYVALSYVWGPTPDESRLNERGALENLPATIGDSIKLCRSLGFRYLWVDRYCIDQKNAEEKAIQIANMGKIYSSAQLTIVASVGEDPSYGLPGITTPKEAVPFIHETIKRLTVILRPLNPMASIATSRWATRGWTYQEGYLSHKRLFFTNRGVHYICNATGGQRFLPRPEKRAAPSKPYTEVSTWTFRLAPLTRNLEAYSARQLSVDADALDAITGALTAQRTAEMPVHHLWGIPLCETDINFDTTAAPHTSNGRLPPGEPLSTEFLLQWYHYAPCRRRPEFPSWSFLGWAGRIFYYPWPRQIHIGAHFTVHNLEKTDAVASTDVLASPATPAETIPRFCLTPPGTHRLDVTVYTLPLAPVHVTWPSPPDPDYIDGLHVAVTLPDRSEIFFPVHWSRFPGEIPLDTPLLGALFLSERKMDKSRHFTAVWVLAVRGAAYERVGFCVFRGSGLRVVGAGVRRGARASVEGWDEKLVSMREWQGLAVKKRVLVG
ncbi:heterokaryon incompatibility protein-domain-containing protein [Boeremia exigua]|uniref:heterokaryon incompatibility protein-domain-containing protein n=1 Tax=Boeremia exigua TaxID=749465 RepID=UPI001E8EE349|nr:heterokaryon incompatibility protein-domain-containing protein [Boeremia exigua]KAH6642102.1 heterokaryon incompatibility protein-domain-containing protein [Boeremia exigua]